MLDPPDAAEDCYSSAAGSDRKIDEGRWQMKLNVEAMNELAKLAYESYFEDRWNDLHPNSIERAHWLEIVDKILNRYEEMREACVYKIGG
jgi:hypothetical protein